jgi:lipopolysaccharide/colanic/teichoic acid biosynthesis glycosyltransferase
MSIQHPAHLVGEIRPEDVSTFSFACDSPYIAWKTAVEMLVAGSLLMILSPIIFCLILLVKATSRGPAVYSQVRLGLNGRPYLIYKLRTMLHDCERTTGPRWATARDPRVTPFGRFLRATHLDELPQLWNVLKGEMSLVGPRPERPEFVRQLQRVIPNYRERLRVRPGITGLAQIQLPPDEDVTGVRRKVVYDLYYLQSINPWLDFRIIVGTTMKVLGLRFALIRALFGLPNPEVIMGASADVSLESKRTDASQLLEAVS